MWFFFSKDTVDVNLSCITKLRTVTADAVKISGGIDYARY